MITLEELIQNNGVAPAVAPATVMAPPPGGGPAGAPATAPGGAPGMVLDHTAEGEPYFRPAEPGETPVPQTGAPPQVGPAATAQDQPVLAQGQPQPAGTPTSQVPQSLREIIDQFGGQGTTQMMEDAPVPTDPNEFLKDYAKGAAYKLAERAGQAVDTIDLLTPQGIIENVVRDLGTMIVQHPDLLDNPKRTGEIFKNLLKSAGLPEPDPSTFGAELGSEQVDSLIMLGALRGAGPYLASLKGGNIASRFVKRMGEAIVKHPYLAAAQDILGATPGGVVARRETGKDLAAIPGAMIGGIAASKMLSTAAYPFKLAGRIKNAWSRPTPTTPLINDAADPLNAKVFAENQYEGDLLRIENTIASTINSIRRPAQTSAQLQAQVYKGMQHAEEVAEGVEKQYWARVKGLNKSLPDDGFTASMAKAITRMDRDFHSTEVPWKAIERIQQMWGTNFNNTQARPTIQKVRSEIRAIRREVQNEWGKTVRGETPNEPLIKNLNELSSMLRQKIAQSDPNNIEMQQAIAMSMEVNNLFSRGAISRILATRRTGEQAVRPSHTVDELMGQVEGLEDVLKMSRRMRTAAPWRRIPGQQNAYPMAIGAETTSLQQLEKDMADSIRAKWHETLDQATVGSKVDPATAARILRQLEPSAAPIGRVATQLHRAASQLASHMEEMDTLTKSTLSKYAQMDANKAIKYVMAAKDPAASARDLMRVFGGDRSAMQGFQNGIMEEFLQRSMKTGANGSTVDTVRFHKDITNPANRRLLEAVWSGPELARLDKMTDIAMRIERGDIKSLTQTIRPIARVFSGIGGAHVGRTVGAITGQPTIQVPGMIANTFRAASERMFERWKPNIMLANAIRDPGWETMLLKQEPSTTKEAHRMLKDVSSLTRRSEAIRAYEQRKFEDDARDIPKDAGPAEHKLRFTNQGTIHEDQKFGDFLGAIGKNMNADAFDRWLESRTPSTNIEDRRGMIMSRGPKAFLRARGSDHEAAYIDQPRDIPIIRKGEMRGILENAGISREVAMENYPGNYAPGKARVPTPRPRPKGR